MEFITEINPAVAMALGLVIMGAVQGVKPFIAERFVVMLVFLFSAIIGTMLALSASAGAWPAITVQAFIYTGLLVGTSSGSYSIAKAVKKENPAGL